MDNCTRTKAVRLKLKEQILNEVYFYVDPQDNFPDHVLASISIIERIHSQNDIHKQLFSESFLRKIAHMFSTAGFHKKRSLHIVHFPGSDFYMEMDTFILCMTVFAKPDDYRCILIEELEKFDKVLDEVLSSGTDLEVERLQKFL